MERPSLILLGDIFLNSQKVQECIDLKTSILSENVKNLFQSSDLVLANLECALTNEPNPVQHKTALVSSPGLVDLFDEIDGYSLSNNHIMDSGIKGAYSTQFCLKEKSKRYWGFGDNLIQARRPEIFNLGNHPIAFLSYSCLTTNGDNYAFVDQSGVAPLALEYIREDIQQSRIDADYVIISLHWGIENQQYPTPDQIGLAHKIIDAGADVIWGHHPHIIQPAEMYKGKIISYSLGNFAFSNFKVEANLENDRSAPTNPLKPHNLESIGLKISIDDNDTMVLDQLYAFRYDQRTTIELVQPNDLEVNLDQSRKNLKRYVNRHQRMLKRLSNPKMVIRFNGAIYQNQYQMLPIDKNKSAMVIKQGFRTLKSFLVKVFRKI